MLKWNKSREGFTESKCGKFNISPQYWGCCKPQNYIMQYNGRQYSAETQKELKIKAEQLTKGD